MTASKILFYFCLSFIIGVGTESLIKIPQIFVWGILFFGASVILFSIVQTIFRLDQPPGRALAVFGFCVLALILGIARVQIFGFGMENDIVAKLNGAGKVMLVGFVSDEPSFGDDSQRLSVKVDRSTVLVMAKRYPEYGYLDVIKVTGTLEEPKIIGSFDYKNYLMKDGIFSVMSFPKISAPDGPASGGEEPNLIQKFYAGILFVKQKLRKSIRSSFLPPHSSILEGTILGDNAAMGSGLKAKLNTTGLRHIIAVSGTHVVILGAILMPLLLATGLWRGQAFYAVIAFIAVYVALTGFSASGIRAGIMGGLYLWAQKLGRQSMGIRVVVLACAAMLAFNPMLLIYDVGFQLSFLAVLGLIYLDPIFKTLMGRIARDKAKGAISMASATLSAQVFTLPIMVYNFGNVSFIAPLTNIIVLPIVTYLMIFGFISSFVGIFSTFLGWISSIPCWVLLKYFLFVVDIFSQPWMAKSFSDVSLAWLFALYFMIFAATIYLNRAFRRDFP